MRHQHDWMRSVLTLFKMPKVGKLQSTTDTYISGLLQMAADVFWTMGIGVYNHPHIVFAGQLPER